MSLTGKNVKALVRDSLVVLTLNALPATHRDVCARQDTKETHILDVQAETNATVPHVLTELFVTTKKEAISVIALLIWSGIHINLDVS